MKIEIIVEKKANFKKEETSQFSKGLKICKILGKEEPTKKKKMNT